MNPKKLSKLYSLACLNAHNLLDELYESIHKDTGDPIFDPAYIKSVRQRYLAKIRHELDLIQSAADESSEQVQ